MLVSRSWTLLVAPQEQTARGHALLLTRLAVRIKATGPYQANGALAKVGIGRSEATVVRPAECVR